MIQELPCDKPAHLRAVATRQVVAIPGCTVAIVLFVGITVTMLMFALVVQGTGAKFLVLLSFTTVLFTVLAWLYRDSLLAPSDAGDWPSRTVVVSRINRVRPVDDLEDFGPGYVVDTADGESVFIAGTVVGDHDHEGEGLASTLTMEISVRNSVLALISTGDLVPVAILDSVAFNTLGIEPFREFCVLEK